MVHLKPGVKLTGIRPELLIALMVFNELYEEFGTVCTITSCVDGVHMPGSKHYVGSGIDFRTKSLPDSITDAATIARRARSALGPDFDIVVEDDHIHCEWDPKTEI